MRRVLLSGVLLAAAAAFVFLAAGASTQSAAGTYKIQFDNAFGLVTGSDFKVSGVPAGTITGINLDPKSLHAVITVQVTKPGFGQFHSDASCASRPQSLIGEYYVDCSPGSAGRVLKPGSTIPVTSTQSTIPADLLQNIMRLPYRQRFTIIVNELGAAAASRGGDLQSALQRAVPALTETDALLNLLANDSTTLQNLTRDSNSVITALANNSKNVNRFIAEADRTAVATATQQANLRGSLARLPGLLEQLRPTLAQLSTTLTTNQPVLENLNQSAGQLNRLFTDLPAFSRSARPAIKSLGQASVTGKVAVTAAQPTVRDLNAFAKPTPELAGNLAIVLQDLDTQSRAVEPDPRSPQGKGFSGLQALLWYVFNQTLAVNTYGPEGHILAVDAFFDPKCSPYATPASIALMLKQYGSSYRQCYSWLGPNQPGVNVPDPSNPGAPVPDPGGAPPGRSGPSTSASRLTAAEVQAAQATATSRARTSKTAKAPASSSSTATTSSTSSTTTTSASTSSTPASPAVPGAPPVNLKASVGQILAGTVGGATGASTPSGSSSSNSASPSQAQQLLNYLLAP
ncbi:MAG TPA: MlaD family protein [Solirubrobacteraceae bacterium]|nr:MlaD family protein [Solirubrobacteraceae bacterium]